MPLQDPQPRDPVHLRGIDLCGFKRHDGLFDIEGHLTDRKTVPFQAVLGRAREALEPIHDIRVRLTIDIDMRVVAAEASSDATPYSLCTSAEAAVQRLVGVDMRRGWTKAVRDLAGGNQGCTHIQEVLRALNGVAFQMMVLFWRDRPGDAIAGIIDTCVAFADDSPVTAMRWPERKRLRADDATEQAAGTGKIQPG